MFKTVQLLLNRKIANHLNALPAANVGAAVTKVMSDPIVRTGIVKTLEAQPAKSLSTKKRMWLA
ncbi:hypothetical protein [Pseudomonas oryzihabitans]|uniref:hypothetical protein n=1 Tax=Pseudomonas oryzihabitans TaxID=47885 RepID=UPI001ABF9B32|nr:hypothetical protein [Pseudomonas oryzihabitans]MDK8263431.1 hypothetical protein [Pseudomonas oryzihabitans]